jgi:hypothetical protein
VNARINAGGKNLVPMAELREAFADAGFGDVGGRDRSCTREALRTRPRRGGALPAPSRCHLPEGAVTPGKAMKVVRLRDGVDQAWSGSGVLDHDQAAGVAVVARS